jgi:hypothetical protein
MDLLHLMYDPAAVGLLRDPVVDEGDGNLNRVEGNNRAGGRFEAVVKARLDGWGFRRCCRRCSGRIELGDTPGDKYVAGGATHGRLGRSWRRTMA